MAADLQHALACLQQLSHNLQLAHGAGGELEFVECEEKSQGVAALGILHDGEVVAAFLGGDAFVAAQQGIQSHGLDAPVLLIDAGELDADIGRTRGNGGEHIHQVAGVVGRGECVADGGLLTELELAFLENHAETSHGGVRYLRACDHAASHDHIAAAHGFHKAFCHRDGVCTGGKLGFVGRGELGGFNEGLAVLLGNHVDEQVIATVLRNKAVAGYAVAIRAAAVAHFLHGLDLVLAAPCGQLLGSFLGDFTLLQQVLESGCRVLCFQHGCSGQGALVLSIARSFVQLQFLYRCRCRLRSGFRGGLRCRLRGGGGFRGRLGCRLRGGGGFRGRLGCRLRGGSGVLGGLRGGGRCPGDYFIGLVVCPVLQQHEYTGAHADGGQEGAEEKENVAFHNKMVLKGIVWGLRE